MAEQEKRKTPPRKVAFDYWSNQFTANWWSAELELPPPIFPETLEEIRAQIERLVPLIAIPKKMGKPHPITARLLAYDVEIAKEDHCWYKPKYLHPNGQKLINALNSFFIYFESLGFRVKINGPR